MPLCHTPSSFTLFDDPGNGDLSCNLFSKIKPPPNITPPTADRKALAELMDRRNQLSDVLGQEKNRLGENHPSVEASIHRSLTFLQEEIEDIDQAIKGVLAKNQQMSSQDRLFQSVHGIEEVTSWTILAYLGDISQFKRNQLVAFSGVAPSGKDTGERIGKRKIRGRKAIVRRSIYMAAKCAATHNPVIRAYVERLCKRGKPYEIALGAAMRKLLIHLHSLSKKQKQSSAG